MESATRSSSQRRAVVAAMVAAGALIAQQVAGRATRDALFLSTFHVSSLPLVMIAAALLSALAMLAMMAAFNVVCLLALSRLGPGEAPGRGTGERRASRPEATGPLSGLRVMKEVPYLRDLALVVALGAATETLLDFILSSRAAATFASGAA